jgi:L-asparaginase/Glu-tRNA(Gln) amidotransferase subunit D
MSDGAESEGAKIFVIMAGGFIAEKYDEASAAFNINTATIATIEEIKNEKHLNIECCEFSLIDSSSADLEYFYELAKVVQRKINFYNTKGMDLINFHDLYFMICIYYIMRPWFIYFSLCH